MMKNIIWVILIISKFYFVSAQVIDTTKKKHPFLQSSILYQQKLNKEYSTAEESPLDSIDFIKFSSLNFYPPSLDFQVMGSFVKSKKAKKFKMKTSTDRLPEYIKYGEVTFELKGKKYKLNVYQNIELSKKTGFEKYLFLPFTDLTNGETTYGGGRYIDVEIPETPFLIIDFNTAYNPYCAYAHRYSCPIPPAENFLNIKIEAGVKEGLIYK